MSSDGPGMHLEDNREPLKSLIRRVMWSDYYKNICDLLETWKWKALKFIL